MNTWDVLYPLCGLRLFFMLSFPLRFLLLFILPTFSAFLVFRFFLGFDLGLTLVGFGFRIEVEGEEVVRLLGAGQTAFNLFGKAKI